MLCFFFSVSATFFVFLSVNTAPSDAIKLKDLSYSELYRLSNSLEGEYAFVSSAAELYNLTENSGKLRGGVPKTSCSPIIMRVSHKETLFQDTQRPQILVSGAVHGDERVGPISR